MLATLLTLSLFACDGGDTIGVNQGQPEDTGDTGLAVDDECATVDHTPIENAQVLGEAVDITATITDPSGIFLAEFYYKQETSSTWTNLALSAQGGDVYAGQIPAADVGSGGMNYYLRVVDIAQNDCTVPSDGEDDPWHFRVTAD